MALDLSADEKLYGKANFAEVTGDLTRRGFMNSMVVAGGAVAVAGTAGYFGYQKMDGKPIKAAIIGTGDEGGVLIGEHNPEFLEFIAISDIRPSNQKRAFTGDKDVPLRKGLTKVYGADAEKKIKVYIDYKEMLEKEKDIEAVVIATPLISHAPIAIDCLKAGKHVLCEKLMARTIGQCKEMIKAAADNDRILSIGHQRHYSMLYAHAVEVLGTGLLGDVKHIRALWHRNFSWPRLDVKGEQEIDPVLGKLWLRDGWTQPMNEMDVAELSEKVKKYGYKNIEELIRWRLYNRTGGGLMAELGSHQLDACSIFLGHVHPIAVTGIGTHSLYGFKPGDGKPNPREIDDHVFATYEFPGKNHPMGPNKGTDKDDVVVVTYSSISTNGFEPYGECVMGTRGTMIVEAEQNVYLYTEKDPNKKGTAPSKTATATVTTAGGGKPAIEAGPTWGGPAAAQAKAGSTTTVSRGYREEMEDFAYCIKLWGQGMDKERRLPRCHGKVAMADAIIALTSNLSMKHRQRIVFDEKWFDPASPDVPDAELKFETV
ncbi:MAG: Gfo/Idh/MocA family oxidoreductase [Gemmataceae bacterium]